MSQYTINTTPEQDKVLAKANVSEKALAVLVQEMMNEKIQNISHNLKGKSRDEFSTAIDALPFDDPKIAEAKLALGIE